MNKLHKESAASGFAVVEMVLVVVLIAAVVGVGAYVLHQKNKANTTLNQTSPATAAKATAPITPTGSTANISQLTLQDAQTEAGVDSANDSQAQQASTSANGAISNVGGAYNENNL